MAFDRPIEADRVDDLGLLSTFVRAPILGPVMWILGKKLLPDEKTEKGENDHKLIEECAVSTSPGDAFTLKNSSEKYPDLASSSISDIIDEPSVDDIDCNESEYHRRRKPVVDSEETKLNETPHPLQRMKKKSRKMSWSDESGQNLVEYCDVSQSSSQHNSPPLQSFPSKKPIKSAMKKSSASYGIKQGGKAPLHPSQCIPSGLAGGSIVMPSGGGYQQSQHQQQHAGASGANGYISPQYGWYISMTPPTPPHFHESSSSSSQSINANKNNGDQQQTTSSYTQYQTLQQQYHFHNTNGTSGFNSQNHELLPPLQQQNTVMTRIPSNRNMENDEVNNIPRPVFKRSLKGVPNDTSGWPSVPM